MLHDHTTETYEYLYDWQSTMSQETTICPWTSCSIMHDCHVIYPMLLQTNQLTKCACNGIINAWLSYPSTVFGEQKKKKHLYIFDNFFSLRSLDGFLFHFLTLFHIFWDNMPMNSTASSASSIEMRTIDDYKIQNDQYWTIIEKQRLIIKTMQKSLNQLTS